MNPMNIQATVVKHTGSHYLLTKLPEWNLFPAVMRGRVRQKHSTATNPVAVGDRVICEMPDTVSEENPAAIMEILPRDNYVIRRSTNLSREAHIIAANVDTAFIIVTLAFPEVKLPFLDRMLVTCGMYGVKAVIVLNKTDLLEEIDGGRQAMEHFCGIYSGAGYRIIRTSVATGQGVDELREAVCGIPAEKPSGCYSTSLFSGMSGVGKSSLIKALDPSLDPRVSEISLHHLQGRHTTTFYEMYPVAGGGFVVDTPGIRSFGLLDLEDGEAALYFPEMLRESASCRFTPCTHTHEPGCAVKAAVDAGIISPERYNSYLGMLGQQTKYR